MNNCTILFGESFTNRLSVSDQDRLSILPDDCLRFIFQYFDNKDLVVITSVSQRLHSVSELLRKEAKKNDTKTSKDKLILRQEKDGYFRIYTHTFADDCETGYFLLANDTEIVMAGINNPFIDLPPVTEDLDKSQFCSTPCHVFNKLKYLLTKFNFGEIRFHSVIIDTTFLDHCERIFIGQTLNECVFVNTVFPKDSTQEHLKRFTAFAHSFTPKILKFLDKSTLRKNDAKDLLQNLVNTEAIDCSYIISAKYAIDVNMLDTDVFEMFQSLIKFKSFDLPNLIIDADCLLMLIQARSRINKEGEFRLSTTREIGRDEIVSSLDEDIRYVYNLLDPDANKHRLINVDGNPDSRVLIHIDNRFVPCEFFVNFGRSAFKIKT